MMIKNGERRRTPGGVFLQLLRDYGSDENEARVNNKQVKLFFAQSNQRPGFQNSHKNKKSGKRNKEDFNSELEAFKKLSKNMKKVQNHQNQQENQQPGASGDSDLKPLPDILTCISQRMKNTEDSSEIQQKSESFDEPNAPPNSVERTLSSYDDDFLSTEVDTEDIELF